MSHAQVGGLYVRVIHEFLGVSIQNSTAVFQNITIVDDGEDRLSVYPNVA